MKKPGKYRLQYQLSGKHVVWFGESNQWVAFEDPAFIIWQQFEEGKTPGKISSIIASTYGITTEEAKQFTTEILDHIHTFIRNTNPFFHPHTQQKEKPNTSFSSATNADHGIHATHSYLINGQHITVDYGTRQIETYLHSPVAHLESGQSPDLSYHIAIRREKDIFILSNNGKIFTRETDLTKIKPEFDILLLDAAYGIPVTDWFARIHASAVSDAEKAIILTSGSGAGKSTLAAILQSRGLFVTNDDLVPLHRKSQLLFPTPSAISVKQGATDVVARYLPNFDPDKTPLLDFGIKKVRFVPPDIPEKHRYQPAKVSAVVMVSYDPNTKYQLRELSDFDGFKRLHDHCWTDGSPENAKTLFEWFNSITCYELTYSDSEAAMNGIEELLGKSDERD